MGAAGGGGCVDKGEREAGGLGLAGLLGARPPFPFPTSRRSVCPTSSQRSWGDVVIRHIFPPICISLIRIALVWRFGSCPVDSGILQELLDGIACNSLPKLPTGSSLGVVITQSPSDLLLIAWIGERNSQNVCSFRSEFSFSSWSSPLQVPSSFSWMLGGEVMS